MVPHKLDLSPEPLHDESELTTLVHDAFNQVGPDVPLFSVVTGTNEPVQAFVARTPDIALKWICRRVSKRRLMRFVNYVYDNPHLDVSDNGDECSDDAGSGAEHPAKRTRLGKEPTTRQVNKRLKEQMDFALLEAIASTQDIATAKKKDITYSPSEQRYRNFAKQLRGVGVSEVAEMINRASAVATFDCLQDWRVLLETWRESHHDGKRLFANMATRLPVLEDGVLDSLNGIHEVNADNEDTQMALSQVRGEADMPVVLTQREVSSFQNLLATVRRSETAGILGDMRHRWIMAALYAEYMRLESILRKRVNLRTSRGRGIATVAREQLFKELYEQDRDSMGGDDKPTKWKAWNRYLEYGKRWLMLKERFGVGVFGLLPRTGGFNSFVERRPLQRLEQWIDMLSECNINVKDIAVAMEPLLVSCMQEEEPPGQLMLETITTTEFDEWAPEDLFLPVADTQREFEIVPEHEEIEIDDSQPID